MTHWPQWTFIILAGVSALICAAKHGTPKGDYNIVVCILDTALTVTILYYGGFFAAFGWAP